MKVEACDLGDTAYGLVFASGGVVKQMSCCLCRGVAAQNSAPITCARVEAVLVSACVAARVSQAAEDIGVVVVSSALLPAGGHSYGILPLLGVLARIGARHLRTWGRWRTQDCASSPGWGI